MKITKSDTIAVSSLVPDEGKTFCFQSEVEVTRCPGVYGTLVYKLDISEYVYQTDEKRCLVIGGLERKQLESLQKVIEDALEHGEGVGLVQYLPSQGATP